MHSRGGVEDTAFRKAEKRYQQHFEQLIKVRRGKRKGVGLKLKETDFTGILDFTNLSERSDRVTTLKSMAGTAYGLRDKPGFCFLVNGVSSAEQWKLVTDSFTRFTQPPATTNHTAQYGAISDLWEAAQQGTQMFAAQTTLDSHEWQQLEGTTAEPAHSSQPVTGNCSGEECGREACSDSQAVSASTLLSKLRWASVGPNFDWSSRRYLHEEPQQPLPQYVVEIGQRCVRAAATALQEWGAAYCQQSISARSSAASEQPVAAQQCSQVTAAARRGEQGIPQHLDYQPDAALVNFYGPGDTLGGHRDDVEMDLSKPIVSISLGCSAVFLLGGSTKSEAPDAVLLRSGDVVVLSGESRGYFHGMPRILCEQRSALPGQPVNICPELFTKHSDAAFMAHMQNRRINISIRETL